MGRRPGTFHGPDLDHAEPVDEDEQHLRARAAVRRQVVEAVLWAATHGEELARIASAAPTRRDALGELTGPPYRWSEFQAHHMLDLTFGRLSKVDVSELQDELDQLDSGGGTSNPA